MERITLNRFGGVYSSQDARLIPPFAAQDCLNVRANEVGALAFRYGWNGLQAAQTNFTASYGLDAVVGYNASYTEVEGYVSFDAISGATRPFWRLAGTMAPTELKTGATSLDLSDAAWRSFAYQDKIIFYCPTGATSAYYITFANITAAAYDGVTAIKTPAAPAAKPTLKVVYNSSDTRVYGSVNWAGIAPATEITYTGDADDSVTHAGYTYTSALQSTNELLIQHIAAEPDDVQVSSIQIDLNAATAGVQDFTYNDVFYFQIRTRSTVFQLDKDSIVPQFINNDGSPLTLSATDVKVEEVVRGDGYTYHVWFEFYDKTRASYDNIRYFKLTYKAVRSTDSAARYSATLNPNSYFLSKLTVGCVRLGTRYNYLGFRTTTYDSVLGVESGFSPYAQVGADGKASNNLSDADGSIIAGTTLPPLGAWVKVTVADPGSSADNIRVYVQDKDVNNNNIWRRAVSQADSSLNYYYRMTEKEMQDLTKYVQPGPFELDDILSATVFRGAWVVWGTKGGRSNIKHSRIGEPFNLANVVDDDELDLNRGASFTLADNMGDQPFSLHACGESLVIVGEWGIYSQYGDRPSNMTPPKRLPGSMGCAGKFASCVIPNESGNHSVAFLSKDGSGVYLASPSVDYGAEGAIQEITADMRDKGTPNVRTFLLNGRGTPFSDLSHVTLGYDQPTESLWVVSGYRAMVWRRSGPNGERMWELYEYNLGGASVEIKYMAFTPDRRIRAMLSDGRAIEIEWNNTSQAYITGTAGVNRDGGNAPTSGYWFSKKFSGEKRRLHRSTVNRSLTSTSVEVKGYTNELTAGEAAVTGTGDQARYTGAVRGRDIWVRILIPESLQEVYSVDLMVSSPLGGRLGY